MTGISGCRTGKTHAAAHLQGKKGVLLYTLMSPLGSEASFPPVERQLCMNSLKTVCWTERDRERGMGAGLRD